MYWALAYGVIAGVILFVVYLLSNYITLIWFPVFLAGVIYGGFRNYKKQRNEWTRSQGVAPQTKPVMQEFREAVADIAVASQEMMAESRQQEAAEQEEATSAPEQPIEPQEPQPPIETPPTPPAPPVPPQQ